MSKRRFFRLVLLGAVLLGFCYVESPILLFVCDAVREYFDRIPFDPAAWKGADLWDTRNPIRLRMVDDLVRRHQLVGMTRGEVDQLLGVPPQTAYFRAYEYVYWLGPERAFFSIDSEWLVLKFEQDRVAEARVVRD